MSSFDLSKKPKVQAFFDQRTFTVSYVVWDENTRHAAVIDSVLDYEPNGALIYHESANKLIDFINENHLQLVWILETHAHADHLSAASYLKQKLGGKIAIGEKITEVQKYFFEIFELEEGFKPDGSQFDKLLTDGEKFMLGEVPVTVLATPGHTPADYTFVFGDAVFPGDTLFMPDFGSARCDFPGGSAENLFDSVQKIFDLPESMRMFMCHDYLPSGRTEYAWETTIGEEKNRNIHLKIGTSKAEFTHMRHERDATLDMPKLIIPSLQVNILAGELPLSTKTGRPLLKVPVNSVFAKSSI